MFVGCFLCYIFVCFFSTVYLDVFNLICVCVGVWNYIYISWTVLFLIFGNSICKHKRIKLSKKPNFLKKKEKQKGLFFIFFFIIWLLLDSFFLLIQLEINKSKQWIQISSFSLHLENFKIGRRIYKNTNKFSQNLFSYINQKIKKKKFHLKKRMIYFVALFFYM